MGIDIKCLRIVFHFGSPATIEGYQQETGRAGRDGTRRESVLLWNSSLLRKKMRAFIINEEFCRRRLLMKYFDSTCYSEVSSTIAATSALVCVIASPVFADRIPQLLMSFHLQKCV